MSSTNTDNPSTLITAAWVAPITSATIGDGAVLITGDRIAAVGPAARLRRDHPDATIHDAGDVVLLPGLVNAHAHLELSGCTAGDAPASFAEFAVNRRGYDADRARHCDIREPTLPSVGRLSLQGHNGSATVKGCLRSDVLVGARVDPAVEVQAADLLLLPNEYFAAENRILRAQLPARTTHPG